MGLVTKPILKILKFKNSVLNFSAKNKSIISGKKALLKGIGDLRN